MQTKSIHKCYLVWLATGIPSNMTKEVMVVELVSFHLEKSPWIWGTYVLFGGKLCQTLRKVKPNRGGSPPKKVCVFLGGCMNVKNA